MPHIYPPAAPTISGNVLTISRFLNNPAVVQRRLRTLVENRFIADVLLSGRYEVSGGALLYEQSESMYTDKAPEAVNAGAEYPRSPATPGPAALAGVVKWGQDVPITDEHVKRYGRRAVDTALTKITNYMVRQVDSLALAVIAAAATQTAAATGGGGWSGASADPLLDLLTAAAVIRGNDQGYEPDVAVMSDLNYARLLANPKVISGLARESNTSVTMTGEVLQIAGLRILATNNLPVAATSFVMDTSMTGGLAYERLESPEYQGDPANGVESWIRRDPAANDQWIVRGRRPVAPVVQEPGAIYKITGL